jgi:hypothetical protein
VITFAEHVDPKEYPTLHSKHICLQTDTDITAVLHDILKLSKTVKSVDLLNVLHYYNDSTTSLVEIPCSAKQSDFKKQARRSRWVHHILKCVRMYSKLELLDGIEREGGDNDDDEFAFTDDDTAGWLITYLGECFPSAFVKSAQALDMSIHQSKMDAVYTTTVWSDAGVGVAAQRVVSKYFFDFLVQIYSTRGDDQPPGSCFSAATCWSNTVYGSHARLLVQIY